MPVGAVVHTAEVVESAEGNASGRVSDVELEVFVALTEHSVSL